MLVKRWFRRRHGGHGMRGLGGVVVPVRVRSPAAVAMDMEVPREHGHVAAQRRIERIVRRLTFMAVPIAMPVIMAMVISMLMLGELGLIAMRVAAMLDRDHDVESVGLRNRVGGFPEGAVIGEQEGLPRSIRT